MYITFKVIKNILCHWVLHIALVAKAQLPDPALVGYWHNWNDVNAPYIQLDQIDPRYNVIAISFAVPQSGTGYKMEFIPDQVSPATLISQIQNLQGQGKKVFISMGGAASPVSLDNIAARDTFITTMGDILDTYGFDGIDIDFEGSSVSVTGGTIASPVDTKIINLIYAVKQIMSNYYSSHQKKLLLTMAPETAFVQGGMDTFGGIWGAYLPVIDALRDSLTLLQVQLYNSGSMQGIDGNYYSQGTADFIIAMTEAVIHGFNTAGGYFYGLPESRVAVGLPACLNAAGGGYTDTATVKAAMEYLRGTGQQPGSYFLANTGGYPAIGGLMTWSVNWDATMNCGSIYQYAESFENIFDGTSAVLPIENTNHSAITIYPDPATDYITISLPNQAAIAFEVLNSIGIVVLSRAETKVHTISVSDLPAGLYIVKAGNRATKFIKY